LIAPGTQGTTYFYQELPCIENIADITRLDKYVSVPSDWSIIFTDVINSTAAIALGDYKVVNIAGVATITVVHNICQGVEIPFVFGGDGAVILVPSDLVSKVTSSLRKLSKQVNERLKIKLRVGCIPIASVRERGADVRIAKYRPSHGNHLAMFSGGGVLLAEQLFKASDSPYLIRDGEIAAMSLDGLECRWNEISSVNGRVMTLIIQSPENALETYAEIIQDLHAIAPLSRPLKNANIPMSWPPKFLMAEMALKEGNKLLRYLQYLRVAILTGIFKVLMNLQKNHPASITATYVELLLKNTDDLKIDDYLRMVIDVSSDQAEQIEKVLNQLESDGRIKYGVHYSDTALFTCLVASLDKHTHFIDGNDGGYCMAAKNLKSKAAINPRPTI